MSESRIYISRGVNRQFRGMVRLPGHRKWEHAGPNRKTQDAAAKDMLRKFLEGNYKRGAVLFSSDYYDPVPVMELSR